jgi:N-formylmaleamate deformylase
VRRVVVCLLVLAACGDESSAMAAENGSAGARPAPHGVARRFKPTAFSVEVRGRGRPVILIPGLGCPASVWRGTVEHLHGYQTHAVTLAGFAGTPRIDGPLLATAVEQLARYIRDRHLASPVIIGHSLGGSLAYWLAAREPDLVGPTIIVDAGVPDGPADRDAAEQARAMWRDAGDDQFAQRVKETFGQMSVKPERLAPLLTEIARSDRRAIGDAVYELAVTGVQDRLSRIRAPILLVLADGSLQGQYRRQAEAIRDHDVVVVPETGHFVMLDDPPAFFAVLDHFLARHARHRRPSS